MSIDKRRQHITRNSDKFSVTCQSEMYGFQLCLWNFEHFWWAWGTTKSMTKVLQKLAWVSQWPAYKDLTGHGVWSILPWLYELYLPFQHFVLNVPSYLIVLCPLKKREDAHHHVIAICPKICQSVDRSKVVLFGLFRVAILKTDMWNFPKKIFIGV